MPLFDFGCKSCDVVVPDVLVRSSELTEALESWICPKCGSKGAKNIINPNIEFMSPEALGRKKAPSDFRNFLSQIKKRNPGSAIRDH